MTVIGFFHNTEASTRGYECCFMILNDESGLMWQEVVTTHFRVIFRSVPIGTKDTHKKTARIPHLQPVFRLNTSQIPVRCITAVANNLERWCSRRMQTEDSKFSLQVSKQ